MVCMNVCAGDVVCRASDLHYVRFITRNGEAALSSSDGGIGATVPVHELVVVDVSGRVFAREEDAKARLAGKRVQ
jgi:hypothetical protein